MPRIVEPSAVYPLLVAIDGSLSTEATRLKLRHEHQADISKEILLTLYRYRILDQVRAGTTAWFRSKSTK